MLGTLVWAIGLFYMFGNIPGLGGFNGITGLPPISSLRLRADRPTRLLHGDLERSRLWLPCRSQSARQPYRPCDPRLPTEVMAESFGVATGQLRIQVFLFAALLAGMAGWLQAHYIRVVNPGPFSVNASVDYLFMVVIGGTGQLGGALIGPMVFETVRTGCAKSCRSCSAAPAATKSSCSASWSSSCCRTRAAA